MNALLDMDKKEHVMLDSEPDSDDKEPEKAGQGIER